MYQPQSHVSCQMEMEMEWAWQAKGGVVRARASENGRCRRLPACVAVRKRLK